MWRAQALGAWFSPRFFQANSSVKEADGDEEASRQAFEYLQSGKQKTHQPHVRTQEPPVDEESPLKKAKGVPWQWKSWVLSKKHKTSIVS